MMKLMDEILEQARDWMNEGHKVAFATVISTWGSSPRPVGSQIVVNDKGAFAGSVAGGCIETFVVSEALDDQPIARVVNLRTGESSLVDEERAEGSLALDASTLTKARHFAASDSSDMTYVGMEAFFVRTYAPPRKIVIIGAVHITQSLAPMALTAGFSVTVIDPRPLFSKDDRFPGIELHRQHPERVFPDYPLDARTAVVALAHDPVLDDPALKAALTSPAYYIGALGSRNSHAKRLSRMGAAGFSHKALARIHGPVGLDIGGRSPAHIALSILAQIVATGNGKA
jgi:xanthine dehydrogenase accessory factor